MKGATLLGHHVHPMVIVFPLGLLGGSVVFDIVRLATHNPVFAVVTYWLLAAGVIGGLVAAVFGIWDWTSIPGGTRAKRVGLLHGLSNILAVALFAASWLMRRSDPDLLPSSGAFVSSLLGLGVALLGGWLGGELVERLGVAVYPDANLNAPNSLSKGSPGEAPRSARPQPVSGARVRPR